MNNKGISLVTVIVIIIVMIIIATISIISGNKLIFETKELKDNQNIEGIKEAISRVQKEVSNSGTLTPKGEILIGRYSPAVGNGETQAIGWYLLDEEALKELGTPIDNGRFLVHYDRNEVLDMSDPLYYEQYNVVEMIYDSRDEKVNAANNNYEYNYPGEALGNISTSGDGKIMYRFFNDAKQTELYGEGWYYVTSADVPVKYVGKINNDYLVDYENAKYVLVTSQFERIGQ